MTPASARVSRMAWIAWAAVSIIWGTTYLGIKVTLDTVPPFLMGGIRYFSAGLMLAAILRVSGHRLPPLSTYGRFVFLGFFMLVLGNGGVVWGEQYISSGFTAVLIGTSPFWMVSVDALMPGGARMHVRQWLGLLIGFSGILILVWPDIATGGTSGRAALIGAVSVQIACLGWAIGSAYQRRHVMPKDVLGSAALQMTFGGLWMLLVGTLTHEWPRLSFNARTGWTLAYLTIVGAGVAYAAFAYALRHLDVAIVSLYSYINPVIAVILGVIILGEPFHMRMVVAGVVIVMGSLIVKGKYGQEEPRSTDAKGGGSTGVKSA